MSSAPSGRYQSKLFNFVHQRSRRLSEGAARAFRQLQVKTTWSVQALLYPVYLLLQSTQQTVLHSFKQHPQHAASQLPAPTADTPIQQVLMAVNTLLLEEPNPTSNDQVKPLNLLASNILMRLATLVPSKFLKTISKSSLTLTTPSPHHPITPLPQRSTVQGIATQLSTRTLVLVTAQNEILDILTPQQQQRLQQRIIGEVAAYWRHRRLADLPPSTVLFTLPRKVVASLLPQKSRVRSQAEAIAKRSCQGQIAVSPVEPDLIYPYQALTFLDRTVAELESGVVPISQAALALTRRSQELIQVLHRFSMSWFGEEPVSTPEFTPSTTERTFKIEALIWRAVDYFFGDRHQKLGQTQPTQFRGLPQRQASHLPLTHPHLCASADEDPWLTMSDLFDQPATVAESPNAYPPPAQMSERQNVLPANNLVGSIRNGLRRLSERLVRSPQPASASEGEQKTETGEIAAQSRSHSQVDFAPDWIETPATAVGYVKHPLEKLLEWLDRAMLWLERVLVGVWQWLGFGTR